MISNPDVNQTHPRIQWVKENIDLCIFQAKDLPAAVSEVLNTAKGTTFYVLKVAGEHGVPAEKSKGEGKKGSPVFMTEVEVSDDKPEYLKTIDLPQSLLMEIKKR